MRSEVGGVSPTGKSYSYSFRSCDRSCVCLRHNFVSMTGFPKLAAYSGVPCLPCPSLPRFVNCVKLRPFELIMLNRTESC